MKKLPKHSVKYEKFSHWKQFRQINFLVISLVKSLLSRNFCRESVRENFCNFHTAKGYYCINRGNKITECSDIVKECISRKIDYH